MKIAIKFDTDLVEQYQQDNGFETPEEALHGLLEQMFWKIGLLGVTAANMCHPEHGVAFSYEVLPDDAVLDVEAA